MIIICKIVHLHIIIVHVNVVINDLLPSIMTTIVCGMWSYFASQQDTQDTPTQSISCYNKTIAV